MKFDREIELLERRLLTQVARASHQYRLIEPDDRILVAVSGGKDSMTLLHLLREIKKRAPFAFSLVAVNLDQGHPGFPEHVLPDYFEREGYEYRILKEDTYSVVKQKIPEGKTYCSLCSRLRRGILYTAARELSAHEDRTRASPRRRDRDTTAQSLLLGPNEGDAAAAPLRRRTQRGDPAAFAVRGA